MKKKELIGTGCPIIERCNLTLFDVKEFEKPIAWYHVRKAWADGKMEYYEQCEKCVHTCKQSFRISELLCRKFQEAR